MPKIGSIFGVKNWSPFSRFLPPPGAPNSGAENVETSMYYYNQPEDQIWPPKCSKSDQLWYTKKEPDLPKQAPKQANQSGTKPGACTVQIWHPNASKFGSTSGPWLLFSMKLLRSCCSSFRCMVDALAHFEMGIIRCCIQGLMLMMARSTNI